LLEDSRDQAQGLRRMFRPDAARVIEVLAASPGVGRRTVAVNVAEALNRAGRAARLLDAAGSFCPSGNDCGDGLVAALASPHARGASGSGSGVADCIVVTAATPHALPWAGAAVPQALLVVSAASASITAAYAWLKRLCPQFPALCCQVVVNRAASEEAALQVVGNLCTAARAYLGVRLQPCGFVPEDRAVTIAASRGASVLELDPEAPASRAFRRLALQLLYLQPAQPAAETAASIGPDPARSALCLRPTPF